MSYTDPTSALVLVLCGPHQLSAPRGVRAPHYNRIDAGIELALRRHAPLVILGDAVGGQDVREFSQRAVAAGLEGSRIHPDSVSPSNTRLEIARSFSWLSRTEQFPNLERLYFVSDSWHLPRVQAYVHGEAQKRLVGRGLEFVLHAAPGGPQFDSDTFRELLESETAGITDYLLDRPHTPRGKPLGKPEHVPPDLAAAALEAIDRSTPIS